MLEWVSRGTLLDVSINAVPVVILAVLDLLFLSVSPWGSDPLAETLTHVLTLFPLVVLVFATFQVARAIELDAGARARIPSIYTPEGSFTYLLVVLAGALVAAVAYLLLFTSATLPA